MSVKNKRKKGCFGKLLAAAATVLLIYILSSWVTSHFKNNSIDDKEAINSAKQQVSVYSQKNNIDESEYPQELVELLARNSECKQFVMEYSEKKNYDYKIDLSEYKGCKTVPLLMQWDQRWGYKMYGESMMAISGCGPACLSMVAIYLLNDTSMDPLWMARFSEDNGYCIPGKGSSWDLISKGAGRLGLDVTEIPLNEERIIKNLKVNNPIICIMGPGSFTSTGHFIVLTGYEDGYIKVNDPNSFKNSQKRWKFEDFKHEIRNMWVIR
jgi:hypothetical protein